MQVLSDYKNYQQFEPEYKKWKAKLDQIQAKRQKYIQANLLKLDIKDIARTQALLSAIDTMDEFSQSNAEEMEVATGAAKSQMTRLASVAGGALGLFLSQTGPVKKGLQNLIKKHPKLKFASTAIPVVVSVLFSLASSIPLISWAAKKQVGASRKGRFEAMTTDLKNPVHFAVLTPEQELEVQKIASSIPVDKEIKKSINKRMGKDIELFGIFKQFKALFSNDKKFNAQKQQFDNNLNKNNVRFNEKISFEDIRNAKRDQQIMAHIVEKMNYASQEYAEKVELATSAISSLSLANGVLITWLSNKALGLLKTQNNIIKKGVPAAIGLFFTVALSVTAAKLQKQASRVGRYKIKKELLDNPNSLVYISNNKLPIGNIEIPKEKKENIFKFLGRIYKENKEYNDYVKKEGIKTKQYHKALEQIKLTPQQLKDAKTLQMNTFKTFNKVDEKSQQYAESVEAVGELVKLPVDLISSLAGVGLGLIFAKGDVGKILTEVNGSENIVKKMIKPALKFVGGFVVAIAPAITIDTIFTKKQIMASRVADMLALKELQDYRNYVDYDNLSQNKG